MLLHMNVFFCGKIGQTPEKSCCKGFLTWGWERVLKELCTTVGEKSVGVEKICGIENVELDSADWNWIGGHSGVGKHNSWDKWDICKCECECQHFFVSHDAQWEVPEGSDHPPYPTP
jgi:hypothetical protein